MLIAIALSVVMLNIVMLSVVAPFQMYASKAGIYLSVYYKLG